MLFMLNYMQLPEKNMYESVSSRHMILETKEQEKTPKKRV